MPPSAHTFTSLTPLSCNRPKTRRYDLLATNIGDFCLFAGVGESQQAFAPRNQNHVLGKDGRGSGAAIVAQLECVDQFAVTRVEDGGEITRYRGQQHAFRGRQRHGCHTAAQLLPPDAFARQSVEQIK